MILKSLFALSQISTCLSGAMATCPICLETIFPVEEVSISLCKHYIHLDCYNDYIRRTKPRPFELYWRPRCCICRRYEPNEDDVENILFICEDPRDSPQIETREHLNPFGQQLLKDFEDGVTSTEELEDIVKANTEEEDNNQP